jgi:hypothetical protein
MHWRLPLSPQGWAKVVAKKHTIIDRTDRAHLHMAFGTRICPRIDTKCTIKTAREAMSLCDDLAQINHLTAPTHRQSSTRIRWPPTLLPCRWGTPVSDPTKPVPISHAQIDTPVFGNIGDNTDKATRRPDTASEQELEKRRSRCIKPRRICQLSQAILCAS